jgi:hypothetical protein
MQVRLVEPNSLIRLHPSLRLGWTPNLISATH